MPFIGPLKGRESRIPRSEDTQGGRMSHAFYRTAQGRLPRPMSSKGKTTSFFISLRFSSEITWAAMSGIVDAKPIQINEIWISPVGAFTTSETKPTMKNLIISG